MKKKIASGILCAALAVANFTVMAAPAKKAAATVKPTKKVTTPVKANTKKVVKTVKPAAKVAKKK